MMRRKRDSEIEQINKSLDRNKKVNFPWWIFIIVGAFGLGYFFRFEIAHWMRESNTPKEEEVIPEETPSGHTFVWDEPETLMYEDIGSGSLEDTLLDHSIVLEGKYYHLPCPIYRFIQDGWLVNTAGNTTKEVVYEVDNQTPKIVSLSKGEKEIKIVSVISPIEQITPLEDSFVTGLSVFAWYNAEIELPKGIQIDMDRKKVEDILKKENLVYDASLLANEDIYKVRIGLEEWANYRYYEITIGMEEDKVQEIRVEMVK